MRVQSSSEEEGTRAEEGARVEWEYDTPDEMNSRLNP